MHETLYLTMNLLDRYLSQVAVQKNEMQLIGLTALLLASKYEDYWHPRVSDNDPESQNLSSTLYGFKLKFPESMVFVHVADQRFD